MKVSLSSKQSIVGGAVAFVIATSCCWLPALAIVLGGARGLMSFSEGLGKFSGLFIVIGTILGIYGAYQFYSMKQKNNIILQSEITCPDCGFSKTETMPIDACQYFYECENCKKILKPKVGDCCVYCSFGTVKCPPIQEGKNCC